MHSSGSALWTTKWASWHKNYGFHRGRGAAIAAASEEQSATGEEIARTVSDVNTIAGENAASMREASRAMGELEQQAQILGQLIVDLKRGELSGGH